MEKYFISSVFLLIFVRLLLSVLWENVHTIPDWNKRNRVSFGLTLQPGPHIPKSCLHRWDLHFNASFQSRKPWKHFPFINQNQGPQKSVGFLLLNKNHTEVWASLDHLIEVPTSGYLLFRNEVGKKMLLEEDCLCSCCQTAQAVGALLQTSKKNISHWISSLSAAPFVFVLVTAISLFKCRFWIQFPCGEQAMTSENGTESRMPFNNSTEICSM